MQKAGKKSMLFYTEIGKPHKHHKSVGDLFLLLKK